jgi:hypothetical protein
MCERMRRRDSKDQIVVSHKKLQTEEEPTDLKSRISGNSNNSNTIII